MSPPRRRGGSTVGKIRKRWQQSAMGCYLPVLTTPVISLLIMLGSMIGRNYQPLLIVPWLFVNYTMVQYRATNRKHLQMILGSIAIGMGYVETIPVILVCLLHTSFAKSGDMITWCVMYLEDQLDIAFTFGGGHNLSKFIGDLNTIWEHMPASPFRPYHKLKFLRQNGIDPVDPDDPLQLSLCSETPRELGRKIVLSEAFIRRFMIGTAMLMIILINGVMHVITLVGMMIIIYFRSESDDDLILGMRPTQFRDGVYESTYIFMGVEFSTCIATVYRGVLHAPYHGMGRTDIRVGDHYVSPYFISGDIITYGGLPKYTRLRNGDVLYENHERKDCYTHGTRVVQFELDEMCGEFIWPSTSISGESGSPMWTFDDDKNLKLVGMVGHYGRGSNGKLFEHFSLPDCGILSDEDYLVGKLETKTTYPGSGKTRRDIPRYVDSFIHRNKSQNSRCYVAGPTRVVAREIYEALRIRYGKNIGLAIAHSGALNRVSAPVVVTTHATMMNLIGKRGHHNVDMVIIDEAHTTNPATRMCVDFAEYVAATGGIGVLLSATLNGVSNRDSNYTIHEDEISESELYQCIADEIQHKRKVLVFTHSARGAKGAEGIASKLIHEGYRAIPLHRGTYTIAMEAIAKDEYDVIVSTNIAECGFNANIDTVIDMGTEFDYFTTGGVTEGRVVKINEASKTQRRGRVGRSKEGMYIQVKNSYEHTDDMRASEEDFNILRTARKWGKMINNEWKIDLTDPQFCRAMEYPVTPLMATVLWDLNGEAKSREYGTKEFMNRYGGGTIEPSCKQCSNFMNGWKKFDEREHELYHMIMKGTVSLKPYEPEDRGRKLRVGLPIPRWS